MARLRAAYSLKDEPLTSLTRCPSAAIVKFRQRLSKVRQARQHFAGGVKKSRDADRNRAEGAPGQDPVTPVGIKGQEPPRFQRRLSIYGFRYHRG
jgi:hypothetical protein